MLDGHDDIATEGQNPESGLVAFQPRARLLKLLGEELISDEIVAIVELVKNAHDADASTVRIDFQGVAAEGGAILITDDGHGMSREVLLRRWMQPAGSAKGRAGTRYTPAGRRMLGEKGVGRFAADKLASQLELVSRTEASKREVIANFDWDAYDTDDLLLEDIRSHWSMRKAEWLDAPGTVLLMTDLRSVWTEKTFRRLCSRLSRLVSPFQQDGGFNIVVESDEFPEYAGEVTGFLSRAPYSIDASMDEGGRIQLSIDGGSPVAGRWPGESAPTCGRVRARIMGFDLETNAVARIGPRMEVRAWLKQWSGVSVYRDGFRVWPYGEPHDDWLRLDKRRVNNPVVRLSNNQVVGFIEISADDNPLLRDQTNREGLVRNDAHADLQSFVMVTMTALEAHRQAHRNVERGDVLSSKQASATPASLGISDELDGIAAETGGKMARTLRAMATRGRKAATAEAVARQQATRTYVGLAGAGQSARMLTPTLTDDVESLVDGLQSILMVRGASSERTPGNGQSESEENLLELARSVETRLKLLQHVSSSPNRRRRGMDVVAELERNREAMAGHLDAFEAILDIEIAQGVVGRTEMRPETFSMIFHAFVQNSIDWTPSEYRPEIHVGVSAPGSEIAIVITDRGLGVSPGLRDTIFEPGVTGKDDGAGLGLSVARSMLEMHGGSVSLDTDGRRRGARFQLTLPRKRSRAVAR